MNFDEILIFVEQILLSRHLSPIEQLVFRYSWNGQTYVEIEKGTAYSKEYIKEVGSKLWSELSEVLGEKVTKKTLHIVLNQHQLNRRVKLDSQIHNENSQNIMLQTAIEFPGRPLPVDSSLYINRAVIEELANAEIHKPGCVLRIKAPRRMGKSSLVNQIIAHATTKGYKTVFLDFQEADTAVLTDLDKFLRWFCANISIQLHLTSMLDDYWDEDIGSKISCKLYFEGYLLPAINTNLVLVLNEVNRIFEYPKIAQDFLPMLRAWHEQAMRVMSWQKLRLVVVHSTEVYVPLKLTQSPFNIGLALKLPEFSLEQVQELAQRYGFTWAEGEMGRERLAPLMAMVGGHPFLLNIAFYQIFQGKMTLEELLQDAPQPAGIYSEHLRNLLTALQKEPELTAAMKLIISNEESVYIEPIVAYKLESMGIIHLVEGHLVKPSCQLYRLYFRNHLKKTDAVEVRLKQLEQKNQELQRLSNQDELTQLANRRYFNQYLQTEWQQQEGELSLISLILCDIDYFRFYNDPHGHSAGDECLRQIAKAIRGCVKHLENVVARYGGDEFAVILAETDAKTAVNIAEDIRIAVKDLGILYDNPSIGGLPADTISISVGVASVKPSLENYPEMLIAAAEKALQQSKMAGCDRVTCFTTAP